MTAVDIQQAVEELWRSRQQGVYYLLEWSGRLTLEEAERVQLGLLDRAVAGGARQVGWKVGLTSQAMRDQFQVREPLFGYLLEGALHPTGARFAFAELVRPGVENEVCMVLGSDLSGPDVEEAAALRAVAGVLPALEIIETRGDFTGQLPLAVADNIQQKAIVLGPETAPLPPDLDLSEVRVAVLINGQQVAEGTGAAVLGHPARSLAWLANKLARLGRGLRAGQIVMTGSLTRQFPVEQGDKVEARFDPLGEVSASFV